MNTTTTTGTTTITITTTVIIIIIKIIVIIATLPKCFIGNYMKNRDSIKQRNGTYSSQKKF